MATMLVSIDRAGRVVIPKEFRDRLSLEPDAALEVTVAGNELRLTPVRQPGRVVIDHDGWPVIERANNSVITDADVQAWRDGDQR
jgi:AbrB family looped-hinge helix DNA binding protein